LEQVGGTLDGKRKPPSPAQARRDQEAVLKHAQRDTQPDTSSSERGRGRPRVCALLSEPEGWEAGRAGVGKGFCPVGGGLAVGLWFVVQWSVLGRALGKNWGETREIPGKEWDGGETREVPVADKAACASNAGYITNPMERSLCDTPHSKSPAPLADCNSQNSTDAVTNSPKALVSQYDKSFHPPARTSQKGGVHLGILLTDPCRPGASHPCIHCWVGKRDWVKSARCVWGRLPACPSCPLGQNSGI
jgi:hypothetical protein